MARKSILDLPLSEIRRLKEDKTKDIILKYVGEKIDTFYTTATTEQLDNFEAAAKAGDLEKIIEITAPQQIQTETRKKYLRKPRLTKDRLYQELNKKRDLEYIKEHYIYNPRQIGGWMKGYNITKS